MIQITLNFASIEAARAALLEIPTSALVAAAAPAPAKVEDPKSVEAGARAATQPAPVAEKAASTAPATDSPSEGNVTPAATATASPTKPADSVDYATLQKAVFALAGKSRDAAAAVAGSFGVKTFKDLPETKWGEALAAVQAKLVGLETA